MEFQKEGILLFDSLQIRYYGLIIVFAMLVAAFAAARLAKRAGHDPEHVWGGLTWAIIPGIIFARLWFVLFPSQSVVEAGRDTAWFLQNITDLQNGPLAIWSGGLSIFGAVLGGLLGAYLYVRRNKLPLGFWLDIAAVGTPDDAAEYLRRLEEAGVHAVGLFPDFVNPLETVKLTAEYLF